VHEVEFHVTSAAILLEALLAFTPRRVPAALDDRHVGVEVTVTDGLHECKSVVEAPLVQVVVEEAADTARLLVMFQEEVFVALLLEAWIHVGTEGLAGLLRGGVPVAAVFVETIVRRQVVAT